MSEYRLTAEQKKEMWRNSHDFYVREVLSKGTKRDNDSEIEWVAAFIKIVDMSECLKNVSDAALDMREQLKQITPGVKFNWKSWKIKENWLRTLFKEVNNILGEKDAR